MIFVQRSTASRRAPVCRRGYRHKPCRNRAQARPSWIGPASPLPCEYTHALARRVLSRLSGTRDSTDSGRHRDGTGRGGHPGDGLIESSADRSKGPAAVSWVSGPRAGRPTSSRHRAKRWRNSTSGSGRDKLFVDRRGPLGLHQGGIRVTAGNQGEAVIAPAPSQITTKTGVAGILVNQGLMDCDCLLVETDCVCRSPKVLLDDADVGKRPGESLLISRLRLVLAGKSLLDLASLVVGFQCQGWTTCGCNVNQVRVIMASAA